MYTLQAVRRIAVVLVVVLAGCGAGSGEDGAIASLTSIGTALEAAGFSCAEPANYVLKDGRRPLGTKPAEVLRCSTDGSPVVVLRWSTTDEAQTTATMLVAAGCAAGRAAVALVAADNWIAAADSDADLSPEQVARANEAIADATGGKLTSHSCLSN